jgi:hypothetical protein
MGKFAITLSFVTLASLFAAEGFVLAQRKPTARAGASRRQTATKPQPKLAEKEAPRAETSSAPATDSSNAEGKPWKLNCQERFEICMDDVCMNEQGIRYNCSSALDSFETVKRDGHDIRLGNDLYTYAKGKCVDIYGSCPLAERNRVENEYKIQIQNDFISKNYLDALAYVGDAAAQETMNEFVECMKPLCGPAWSDCFLISQVERRSGSCGHILEKTARPMAVKKAFYDDLEKLNRQFCDSGDGQIDYETKKCSVKVSFGKEEIVWKDGVAYSTGRLSNEIGSRRFMIGEIAECTQDYFGVVAVRRDGFMKGVAQIVKGVVKQVAGVGLIVGGAIASIAGGAGVPLIGSGVQMTTAGTADTIEGYVKMDTTTREGACFVGGKFIAPMGTYFKVGFSQ